MPAPQLGQLALVVERVALVSVLRLHIAAKLVSRDAYDELHDDKPDRSENDIADRPAHRRTVDALDAA